VDLAGNVYIADGNNNAIKEWNASTKQVTTLVSSGIIQPNGMAVDPSGNLYFAVTNNIIERVKAYVPGGTVSEGPSAGNGVLQAVLPTTQSLIGPYTPSSDQSWLTIGNAANGVIPFSFTANPGAARTAHITVLGQQVTVTQLAALGSFDLHEGPAAGSDSVIVAVSGAWTAASNTAWLHTSSTGNGNGLVTFTFDANSGAERTGTLTIAGRILTVNQAGNSFVEINQFTTLVTTGLNQPHGMEVDTAGNVYYADPLNNAIKKWIASTQKVVTLVSSGLRHPHGVAVDTAGNVYIADTDNNAIKKWNVSTQKVTTLVSTGLNDPYGVAVDTAGNVYIADFGNNAIKEWSVLTQQVSTLASSGVNHPSGVEVDAAGNVYFVNFTNNAIKEWNATTRQVSILIASGVNQPTGLAVDTAGNLYFADAASNALKKWNAATKQISTLVPPGINRPSGIAVDAVGNVYIAYTNSNTIKKLVHGYVPGYELLKLAANSLLKSLLMGKV